MLFKICIVCKERRLLEETVVALVDCVCPLPVETRLLVTEDVTEAIVCAIIAASGH